MKKIIASLVFLLAFTVSINAQDNNQNKKVSNQELAKSDAFDVAKLLGLDKTLTESFERLFEMKQEILNNPNASEERKKEMVRIVGLKIDATLDANQIQKLKANKTIYNKVIGQTALENNSKTK